ncbi:MAG: metal ABC transporter substrate-binding protein [Actinobacteria bacterium]|nr:metal ABC transporter substrate-binding protein [Actinomycetota bacterium]
MALAAVVGLLGASCGGAGGGPAGFARGDDRVKVATTVAPITSIVAAIVGDRADVEGIVPEGTDSHTFEPRPSVAQLLSEADVVYMNGLGLEEPTRALVQENLRAGAEIVELGTRALSPDRYLYDNSFPEEQGQPNPHLWTDPTLARRYAEVVRDDLSGRDPGNADHYAANYAAFDALVDELDAAMRASFATIPQRQLLTYHDAYAYFAETYDWEIIGAIQVSDFQDPTPAELVKLIDQIEARGVPAIFGSEVFPSPVLEQIGRETGVRYVDELRDDDLPGDPGDPEHSWLGLMRSNYVTMTEALGGDASALEAFEPRTVVRDTARYPQ